MHGRQHRSSRRTRPWRYAATGAFALLSAVVGLSSTAAAAVDPAPVGPRQFFVGEVNGASPVAVIKVGCFGPGTPDQTGHPISGQFVDVLPAVSSSTGGVGYTGEAANRVVVDFGVQVSTSEPVVLSSYGVRAAIPTTLNLPCSGAGTVSFVPVPTSSTVRSSLVKVTYESIGV